MADWTGKVGNVWADEWRRTDRSFAALSVHLDVAVEAAARPGAMAIDIGCGAGATTLALAARRPDVTATGIDLSAELIAIAKQRAESLQNVRFLVANIGAAWEVAAANPPAKTADPVATTGSSDHPNPGGPLPSCPDLLFSRHGVMFFVDPVKTFDRLRAAAAPDAALVFSCFRDPALNPWASDLVAEVTGTAPSRDPAYSPGPFAFADRTTVTRILTAAGWCDIGAEAIDYRYVAGAGDDAVGDALSFLRRIGTIASALRQAPDTARAAMLDKLAAALHNGLDHGEVAFPAAAWIWRARATGGRA